VVSHPRLEDVRRYWVEDPSALLDIYVVETCLDDWRRAMDAVRQTGWRLFYSEDGEERSMPDDVEEVLARCPHILLQIWPSERVSINCHFFAGDEMEFDASPREIEDQTDFDALCEFITTLGRALGKPVLVGIEEPAPRSATVALRYDPTADAVSAPFSAEN
jgi:hypothetical protein